MSARGRVLLLCAMLMTHAPGCDDSPSDQSIGVAVFVEGQPIYVDEVEHYLESNLVNESLSDDSNLDVVHEVKSRLFDVLIEERLLYAEAVRRGIEVSPLEVAAYLEMASVEEEADQAARRRIEIEARNRLMAQKLQEQIILDRPELTEDQIATYAADRRDLLLPSQPLELRALQLPSMKKAERVHRDIKRKQMTFNEAALAYEPSPGQALPTRMSWESLPDELRETLQKLKPGQVSKPLELHSEIYLFQVGKWLSDPADHEDEVLRRARIELQALRNRNTLDALLDELRQNAKIRIKKSNLTFTYVPMDGESAALKIES